MKRKRWSTLLLCGFSLLFSVTVGEAIARLLRLAPPRLAQPVYAPDSVVPFRQAANARFVTTSPEEFSITFSLNSLGFRDEQHAVARPRGVKRILGLGDSFTQGAGAPYEETYLRRLERRFDQNGQRVEVLKWGIGRYYPLAERLLFEHYGRSYEPDLVLIGFLPNDIVDTYRGVDAVLVDDGYLKTAEAAQLGPIATWLYERSHLARPALRWYVSSWARVRPPAQWNEIFTPGGFHETDWLAVERELKKIIRLADGIGARVAVINIPEAGRCGTRHRYPGRRLARFCQEQGCHLIDTLPAMEQASEERPLYWANDEHCNGDGYAVIADTIFSAIDRAALLDGAGNRAPDLPKPHATRAAATSSSPDVRLYRTADTNSRADQ